MWSHTFPLSPHTLVSVFENVAAAPEDVIFALTAAYKADSHPNKVNLGVGAYRTEEGKPWVLPVVKKVLEKKRPALPPFSQSSHKTCVS